MPIIDEYKGNLIEEALEGKIEIIAHGVNCFCTQKKGIAKNMADKFQTDKFPMEAAMFAGDLNKLGTTDWKIKTTKHKEKSVWVVNMYTQFHWSQSSVYGIPLDYDALRLCFRKLNIEFEARTIGIPNLIGCGLAGGNPVIVKQIIQEESTLCDIVIIGPP